MHKIAFPSLLTFLAGASVLGTALASEPFTSDSAQLCLAPLQPQDYPGAALTISFNGQARIPAPARDGLTSVRLSRSKLYSVVVRRDESVLHAFRLDFAKHLSGNVCLSYIGRKNRWVLQDHPAGMNGCTCGLKRDDGEGGDAAVPD